MKKFFVTLLASLFAGCPALADIRDDYVPDYLNDYAQTSPSGGRTTFCENDSSDLCHDGGENLLDPVTMSQLNVIGYNPGAVTDAQFVAAARATSAAIEGTYGLNASIVHAVQAGAGLYMNTGWASGEYMRFRALYTHSTVAHSEMMSSYTTGFGALGCHLDRAAGGALTLQHTGSGSFNVTVSPALVSGSQYMLEFWVFPGSSGERFCVVNFDLFNGSNFDDWGDGDEGYAFGEKNLGPIQNPNLIWFDGTASTNYDAITVENDESPPYNVFFVMIDDMFDEQFSVAQPTSLQTDLPQIYRIAENGIIYNGVYTPLNGCMANRALHMTGQYWYEGHGSRAGTGGSYTVGNTEFMEIVRTSIKLKNKYKTGMAGKSGSGAVADGTGSTCTGSGLDFYAGRDASSIGDQVHISTDLPASECTYGVANSNWDTNVNDFRPDLEASKTVTWLSGLNNNDRVLFYYWTSVMKNPVDPPGSDRCDAAAQNCDSGGTAPDNTCDNDNGDYGASGAWGASPGPGCGEEMLKYWAADNGPLDDVLDAFEGRGPSVYFFITDASGYDGEVFIMARGGIAAGDYNTTETYADTAAYFGDVDIAATIADYMGVRFGTGTSLRNIITGKCMPWAQDSSGNCFDGSSDRCLYHTYSGTNGGQRGIVCDSNDGYTYSVTDDGSTNELMFNFTVDASNECTNFACLNAYYNLRYEFIQWNDGVGDATGVPSTNDVVLPTMTYCSLGGRTIDYCWDGEGGEVSSTTEGDGWTESGTIADASLRVTSGALDGANSARLSGVGGNYLTRATGCSATGLCRQAFRVEFDTLNGNITDWISTYEATATNRACGVNVTAATNSLTLVAETNTGGNINVTEGLEYLLTLDTDEANDQCELCVANWTGSESPGDGSCITQAATGDIELPHTFWWQSEGNSNNIVVDNLIIEVDATP